MGLIATNCRSRNSSDGRRRKRRRGGHGYRFDGGLRLDGDGDGVPFALRLGAAARHRLAVLCRIATRRLIERPLRRTCSIRTRELVQRRR
jgi:hypothetical protein